MKNDSSIRKEELWAAFKKGDKQAFEHIYRSNVKDLVAYGYKVIVDRKLIEDSIHDLFYELWQNKENLTDTTSIKFYLFGALRYKVIRNARSNDLARIHSSDETGNDPSESPHENYLVEIEDMAYQALHLQTVIAHLPKRQREAVNLRFYHNFSNEQVAAIMEVNYQSACKLIYGALKTLRANF